MVVSFLLLEVSPSMAVLASELLRKKKGDDVLEPEILEMAPLVSGT